MTKAELATPLGQYKMQIYNAVGDRWYKAANGQDSILPIGKVHIQYTVQSDGKVRTQVLQGTEPILGPLLSISLAAIKQATPFPPFSSQLIHQVGNSFTDDLNFSIYASEKDTRFHFSGSYGQSQ